MNRFNDPVFEILQRSKFRAKFRLDVNDIAYIDKIGFDRIEGHAKDFIVKRIAPAKPDNDGKQTPFKGHPVFKAQHATATCCRGCLRKWHRIPEGRALTDDETQMAVRYIMGWIKDKYYEKIN